MLVAKLGKGVGDARGIEAIREAFVRNNPDYDLSFEEDVTRLSSSDHARVVFVQKGEAKVAVGETESPVTVGDIVLVRPQEAFESKGKLGLLVFTIPNELARDLPGFIRPDWDEKITDTPGGCATETGAYRRILLTWLPKNGPYVHHDLNAHRVRIKDSFSHYHPKQGGFDEFYLVQMVQPDAKLLTSPKVDAIENRDVELGDVPELIDETELEVGDLVYLPRGLMHRGLGGVLAQVITVPGFKPGAEIGVDHHLHAINERHGLAGTDALPVHAAGSKTAIVK